MRSYPKPEGDPVTWLQSALEFLRQEAMRLDLTTVAIAITRAIDALKSEIKQGGEPIKH